MENSKITYLLGAGASCGVRKEMPGNQIYNESMPLVKDIPDRLNSWAGILSDMKKHVKNGFEDNLLHGGKKNIEYNPLIYELVQEFQKLSINAKNHASIDTFAKKLYLSDPEPVSGSRSEFHRTKELIDLFLILEQFIHEPDIRYDLFLASIIQDTKSLIPDSINIITWNYDFQIEIALSNISNLQLLSELKDHISNKLLRLNGSSGSHYVGSNFRSDEIKVKVDLIREAIKHKNEHGWLFENLPIKHVLEKYYYYNNLYESSIKFAWENNDGSGYKLPTPIIDILHHTKELVIIGYSFPTFNRAIDKLIFNHLHNQSEIYLQVPDSDFQSIKTKIEYLSEGKFDKGINQIDIMDEFFIPFSFVG